LAALISSLFLCAMTPLTESDLSNFSNPLSLSIHPERVLDINNNAMVWSDSENYSKLLSTLSGSLIHFDTNMSEGLDVTAEGQTKNNKPFSSFPWLGVNNGFFNNVQLFLIDPVTGKRYYELSTNDSFLNRIQNFSVSSIKWKNYATVMNAETIIPEEFFVSHYNNQTADTPSIAYTDDDTRSSNSPYTYKITSGNIDMRDTFINKTNTTIQSGSWTNIRTH
jgi:hypothetical protein